MSGRINQLGAYGKVANAETDPLRQIVMLYDGAIRFLRLAAADIEVGDIDAKAEHSNRALDILSYLQSILDFETGGEVAPVLDFLYARVMMQVLRASAALDGASMRQAAELLMPVREAWAIGPGATDPAVSAGEHQTTLNRYQKTA
jgi:flagellar secretion chaperone FliS